MHRRKLRKWYKKWKMPRRYQKINQNKNLMTNLMINQMKKSFKILRIMQIKLLITWKISRVNKLMMTPNLPSKNKMKRNYSKNYNRNKIKHLENLRWLKRKCLTNKKSAWKFNRIFRKKFRNFQTNFCSLPISRELSKNPKQFQRTSQKSR